jgi:hypothetical protein
MGQQFAVKPILQFVFILCQTPQLCQIPQNRTLDVAHKLYGAFDNEEYYYTEAPKSRHINVYDAMTFTEPTGRDSLGIEFGRPMGPKRDSRWDWSRLNTRF